MITDEDAVHHISENPPLCDRSHVCARGVIAHTYNCTQQSNTYSGGHGKKKRNVDKDNLDGTGDGLQINQKWIRKKMDEVKEDGDETTVIFN